MLVLPCALLALAPLASPPLSPTTAQPRRLAAPGIDRLQVGAEAPQLPCLLELERNPLCAWVVELPAGLATGPVQELRVSLAGTTRLEDIAELTVLASTSTEPWNHGKPGAPWGEALPFGEPQKPADEVVFRGEHTLAPGVTRFWLTARLRAADLDHRIAAHPRALRCAGADPIPLDATFEARRIGRALRNAGDDGSAAYRIPGLVTTNAGTLIAVYDIRYAGWGDLPGNIDVGMSRSTDGGQTWEPMATILDMGSDPGARMDGVGDPAVLVDRKSGRIWVVATWSHGNRAWRGSGPGLSPEETGQLVMVTSDDDGQTWSAPRNLTAAVKNPAWCYLLQGPGRGITMADGTLVFAAQYQDAERMPHATLLVSRDQGDTWTVPDGPRSNTTEAQVVEIDGALMLNMRDNRGGSRAVYTTPDLGKTWSEHPSSRSALVEPVCMASLLRVGRGERPPLLLFSNPAVPAGPRRQITLKASTDLGLSWPAPWHVLLDEGQSAGYSCLTAIDENTVGILFEGSRSHLTFLRVPLPAGLR